MAEFVSDHVQVRLPHVTTHVLHSQADRLAETIQAAPQARFAPIRSDGEDSSSHR